jgi:hypothetical protein
MARKKDGKGHVLGGIGSDFIENKLEELPMIDIHVTYLSNPVWQDEWNQDNYLKIQINNKLDIGGVLDETGVCFHEPARAE